MLPAAFCAGMTLPLLTTELLRSGSGERSIGAIYGFNTIGSIAGVLIAIHLAMPLLGLKNMIILGAGIDIALGIGLAWWAFPSWRVPAAYTAAGLVAPLLSFFWFSLDADNMASGVYRLGTLHDPAFIQTVFQRDGKTATVSVVKDATQMTIQTNGKPDAGIQVSGSGYSTDETTMVMLGALGAIHRPAAKTAAVIGWGSGLSTHVLLASPNITRVDTIEIEPQMVEAAKLFGARVQRAYNDPRSHVQIEDAKTYFSYHNKKYDIIVSEPSNPWVSGVASLFSEEFYARVPSYLNTNGIFLQWLHLYEINPSLIASIMNALSPHFSDYVIYTSLHNDIIIVACPTGALGQPDPAFLSMKDLVAELHRVDIDGLSDIRIRMLGTKAVYAPYFESHPVTANSDYAPIVDLYAVRSRFFHTKADMLFFSPEFDQLPIVQLLGRQPAYPNAEFLTFSNYQKTKKAHVSAFLYQYLRQGGWNWGYPENPVHSDTRTNAIFAKQALLNECSLEVFQQEWWNAMQHTVVRMVPFLSREQRAGLFRLIEDPACTRHFSKEQQDFISLLKAVGDQDPLRMARHSAALLNEMKPERTERSAYILSAGILGNLASGNRREARLLWKAYGNTADGADPGSHAVRLLIAHMNREEEK